MNDVETDNLAATTASRKGPIHQIRIGLIKAAIWRNKTKVGDRCSVSIVRLFKNGDVWKESTRFGRDDLLVVAKVADMAHTWVANYNQAIEKERQPNDRN